MQLGDLCRGKDSIGKLDLVHFWPVLSCYEDAVGCGIVCYAVEHVWCIPPVGYRRYAIALAQSGKIQVVYHHGTTLIYRVAPAGHPPAVLTTSLPVDLPSLSAK